MNNRYKSTLGALVLVAATPLAQAVENINAIPLWFEDIDNTFGWVEHFNSIDFYPNTTGKEVLGFNESISAETAGGNSRTVVRQRFQFRNATTGAQISQFTITTKSDWYPNNDVANDYECNGEYSQDLEPDNSIPDCGTFLSAGVAETAVGGRYLVIGTSMVIDIEDGINEDLVADAYKIHVFNLATDNLLWANTWSLESPGGAGNDWELDINLSGVSDYINDDGTDELRIAQAREQGGNLRWRYRYYNIETGALIDTVSFSTSTP